MVTGIRNDHCLILNAQMEGPIEATFRAEDMILILDTDLKSVLSKQSLRWSIIGAWNLWVP